MKLLFMVRDLGLGGVERCVALVSERLVEHGFDVTIAMLGGNRNLWQAHTTKVRVVDLSGTWHGKQPWTWLSGWRAARALAKEADVVIAATFLMPLYMAWAATLGQGKRLIAWVHGPKAELDAFARMNPIHRTACQMLYRRIPELIFVSDHARQSMSRWIELPSQPGWQVLPNFVEAQPAHPVSGARPRDPLRLLFVGRIAEEKQPLLWLDTLQVLAARGVAAHLTIVGDGPLQGWLADEAQRRQLLDHLEFAGRRDNVTDYLHAADILLLTSNFEGCPLVVLEAMQVGLPVVSTNAGGVYELFGERQDDFIVQQSSGEAIAAKIAAQLPHHAELAAWLMVRARNYTPEALLEKWMTLLKSPHRRPPDGTALRNKSIDRSSS